MYKRGQVLGTACFTIIIAIALYSFPSFHQLSSVITPNTIRPSNEMALSSVSRSVVKKVLAIETPEV